LISHNPSINSNEFAELSLLADYTEIRNASTWLAQTCAELSVPISEINRLDICLNEALANIIEHGGHEVKLSPIIMKIQIVHDSTELTVTLTDKGKPFNPLTYKQKDRVNQLEDAVPGGLGLTMMKEFSDELNYTYSNESNHLSFSVRWGLD
jgi:anti-sigma regulatory factor (Ser/Thr protein kinase)